MSDSFVVSPAASHLVHELQHSKASWNTVKLCMVEIQLKLEVIMGHFFHFRALKKQTNKVCFNSQWSRSSSVDSYN